VNATVVRPAPWRISASAGWAALARDAARDWKSERCDGSVDADCAMQRWNWNERRARRSSRGLVPSG
jgi:hypothetical protein